MLTRGPCRCRSCIPRARPPRRLQSTSREPPRNPLLRISQPALHGDTHFLSPQTEARPRRPLHPPHPHAHTTRSRLSHSLLHRIRLCSRRRIPALPALHARQTTTARCPQRFPGARSSSLCGGQRHQLRGRRRERARTRAPSPRRVWEASSPGRFLTWFKSGLVHEQFLPRSVRIRTFALGKW